MPSILFASAEFAPIARVGGLAEAAAGLVKSLRQTDADVVVAIPDYGDIDLDNETSWALSVPGWAGPATARRGTAEGTGEVILIDCHGMAKPHPYVQPGTGIGWPDNDRRFIGFGAAIAALAIDLGPDVLHLNDWHTAATLGFLSRPPATVLTIHTLGYQGVCDKSWLERLPHEPSRFAWFDSCNPLLGAIRSADKIIAVSPNYAREILTESAGQGLHQELARRGSDLVGIRNGIDTTIWNPALDPAIPQQFELGAFERGKSAAQTALLDRFGWEPSSSPLLGVVSRLVDQKGVDHLAGLAPFLEHLPARLVLLGSGQSELVDLMNEAANIYPDHVGVVTDRYDEELSHLIFAGSDLFLMPSRFEPCGLAQMQAMAYATTPVANAVGGLVDTIVDADDFRSTGTGFLAKTPDMAGFVDAVHRSVRAYRSVSRRRGIQHRGMRTDWSWEQPAEAHLKVYDQAIVASVKNQ